MKKLLLTIATAATMLFSVNKSFAQEVLDQSQTAFNGSGGPPFAPGIGQSFIPTITGELSKIIVYLDQNNEPEQDLFISIFEGNGFGGTPILLNHLVSNASTFTNDSEAEITLPSGVNITAGQTYTFRFTSAGTYLFAGMSLGGGYNNGTFWLLGVEDSNIDLYFKTFVIPAPISTTQLSSCGATDLTLASTIFANPVAGATRYRFNFSNVSLNYSKSMVRSSGFANYPLSAVTGLQYGQTYNVTVQAYVGGVWTAEGSICTISLAAAPPTTSLSTSCNATNLTLTSTIYAHAVAGATKYEFSFVNSSLGYSRTVVRNSGFPNYPLSSVTGLLMGQTYQVSVRAYVGNVWTTPGATCPITLGAGESFDPRARATNTEEVAVVENNNEMISQEVAQVISEEIVTEEVKTAPVVEETSAINTATKAEFTAYPNPVSKSSVLNISFNTEEIGKVILTDITGRIITEQNFNTNLTSVVEIDLADKKLDNGIYNLSIVGNKSTSQKTIVVVE